MDDPGRIKPHLIMMAGVKPSSLRSAAWQVRFGSSAKLVRFEASVPVVLKESRAHYITRTMSNQAFGKIYPHQTVMSSTQVPLLQARRSPVDFLSPAVLPLLPLVLANDPKSIVPRAGFSFHPTPLHHVLPVPPA
jgi:hypothetical protein